MSKLPAAPVLVHRLTVDPHGQLLVGAGPEAHRVGLGHGEGGVTAQTMTANINGVISTGTPCPDEWLEGIAQTPMIIIQGTGDEYLREAKNSPLYGSLEDRCKMLMNQPNWEWLTVEGMGHPAELSRADVKARISQFLKITNSQ